MKIKATKNEIRECVSRAVYRILKEGRVPASDNLDDVEANDRAYYADDEFDSEEEPSSDNFEDTDDEFDGNDDLIQQAMARSNEKPIEDNGITFSTDLNVEDDVDNQIMDELEEMFDAEIGGDDDCVTVTVDSNMADRLEQYFQEHDIQSSKEGGLYESRMRQIIRESIRKTLNRTMIYN